MELLQGRPVSQIKNRFYQNLKGRDLSQIKYKDESSEYSPADTKHSSSVTIDLNTANSSGNKRLEKQEAKM